MDMLNQTVVEADRAEDHAALQDILAQISSFCSCFLCSGGSVIARTLLLWWALLLVVDGGFLLACDVTSTYNHS